MGSGLGGPRIDLVIRLYDAALVVRKHFPECHHIEPVPLRTQRRQILFRETKQTDRRPQPPPVFRMGRIFELLLQMNKGAGGLDQAFEILRIVGRCRLLEPNLLKNIVRLVVSLFVPAVKKCAVIGMVGDRAAPALCVAASQRLHELGNSLAFAHEGRNLVAPAMMGKRARFNLREGERLRDRRRSEK
jgi:hypothetical protein